MTDAEAAFLVVTLEDVWMTMSEEAGLPQTMNEWFVVSCLQPSSTVAPYNFYLDISAFLAAEAGPENSYTPIPAYYLGSDFRTTVDTMRDLFEKLLRRMQAVADR